MTAAKEVEEVQATPLVNAQRTFEFWRRASGVYVSYKGAQVSVCLMGVNIVKQSRRSSAVRDVRRDLSQVKARALRMRGWDDARLKEEHWRPHHDWAGREFYAMAIDLRGFYLKVPVRLRIDVHCACSLSQRLAGLSESELLQTGALAVTECSRGCSQLGQFFAARAEFVPEPICRRLSLLHDQVRAAWPRTVVLRCSPPADWR
jgi:hypothetical protein